MGVVYRARDPRLHRDVALKTLAGSDAPDVKRLERFMREARAASALSHPNILTVYDGSLDGPLPYIVTELINGGTLRQLIASGPLPIKRLLDLAVQIADGLSAAHRAQLVHRDLKPENLMLTRDGRVKIVDFGLVRPDPLGAPLTDTITATHAIVGTIPYMSPEQARGEAVDFRSDLFSFGAVLYEMATGRQPFERANTVETLAAIMRDDPRPIRELNARIPVPLSRIVSRCLAKLPDERYGSTADLLHDLQSVRSDSTAAMPAVGTPARVSARTAGYVAAAVLAAGVIAVGVWLSGRAATRSVGERTVIELSPPPGLVWGELPPEPTPRVSPDGKKVVVAGSASLADGLWVRSLDDPTLRRLPGSQDYAGNVLAPFWSGDSSRVAFCFPLAGAKIRKIRVDDGTFEDIDAKCTGDGSWNGRDQILYRGPAPKPEMGSALYLIAASGGQPSQITFPATPGEDHRHPRWLPDNRKFLFTERGSSAEGVNVIYVGTIGETRIHRVTSETSLAEYVDAGDGSGFLLFVRGGDLVVQPVDAQTLEFAGAATVVTNGMWMGISRLPAFSVSSGLLAYRSDTSQSELAWLDGSGNSAGRRYRGKGRIESFDLSPDEKTIAYAQRNWDTNNNEIRSADVASGSEEVLVAQSYIVGSPVFAPDESRLAFVDTDDYRGSRLGIKKLRTATPPDFFPAIDFIVRGWFGNTILGSSGQVSTVPADASLARTVIAQGLHPQLSPRGDFLAYTVRDSSGPRIYVQRYPEGTSRTVVSQGQGFQPQWRGDREIVYLTDEGDVRAVSLTLGERISVNSDGLLFHARFRAGGAEYVRRDLAVSKDGRRFLVNLTTSDPAKVKLITNWQSLVTSR
jgi:Tol biopolymer transport system component